MLGESSIENETTKGNEKVRESREGRKGGKERKGEK